MIVSATNRHQSSVVQTRAIIFSENVWIKFQISKLIINIPKFKWDCVEEPTIIRVTQTWVNFHQTPTLNLFWYRKYSRCICLFENTYSLKCCMYNVVIYWVCTKSKNFSLIHILFNINSTIHFHTRMKFLGLIHCNLHLQT